MESATNSCAASTMKYYYDFIWPTSVLDSGTAPIGNREFKSTCPNGSDSPATTVPPVLPVAKLAATPSYISKSESNKMLEAMRICTDLTAARSLVAPIMKRYMHAGKGLYPVAVARAVARHPGGLNDAVNILILVTRKTSVELSRAPATLWPSLRKGKGAASRVFKMVDSTLSLIITQHWLAVMKFGAELDWDPLPIVHRLNEFWDDLLQNLPPPLVKGNSTKHGLPHALQPSKPQIFKLSRSILRHAHARRMAALKAIKVAGHRLPPELVGLITDSIYDSAPSLQVNREFEKLFKADFVAIELRSMKDVGKVLLFKSRDSSKVSNREETWYLWLNGRTLKLPGFMQ